MAEEAGAISLKKRSEREGEVSLSFTSRMVSSSPFFEIAKSTSRPSRVRR
jgi:hypothetical protein